MQARNAGKLSAMMQCTLVSICILMLVLGLSVAHSQGTEPPRVFCPIGSGGLVCPLPADNLVQNPWFRTEGRASLDGWTAIDAPGGGWRPSRKPGNPTPDELVGTAARISTGRGPRRAGRTIEPNESTSLVQVVAADPGEKVLNFGMYWVAHTVDPVIVTVYGGTTPDGPWTEVWTPFRQSHTRVVRPESGRGNDLWTYYSALTPLASTTLEQGFPYYKLEITASLPDHHGGLKITGVYFSIGEISAEVTRPMPTEEGTGGKRGANSAPSANRRQRTNTAG